jgi:hypothetical protein
MQLHDYLIYMLKEKTLKSINEWTFEISSILRHSKVQSFFWVKLFFSFMLFFLLTHHILNPYNISPKKFTKKNLFIQVIDKRLVHNFQLQNSITIYLKNICCNFNKHFFLFNLTFLIQ